MQSNPRIKVHTTIAPPDQAEKKTEQRTWRMFAHPRMGTAQRRRIARRVRTAQKSRPRRTFSERLLRNTAVACALILLALALTNVDTPWSKQAMEGIRQALTMSVELDEQIGGMQFVQRLMPESALVFWNMGSASHVPVDAEISHEYSAQQPWQEYAMQGDTPVRAVMDGIVCAVGENQAGEWSIMINHADGLQSIYAFMDVTGVRVGEELLAGAVIGTASQRLYFELRDNGVAVDPAGVLAL